MGYIVKDNAVHIARMIEQWANGVEIEYRFPTADGSLNWFRVGKRHDWSSDWEYRVARCDFHWATELLASHVPVSHRGMPTGDYLYARADGQVWRASSQGVAPYQCNVMDFARTDWRIHE